MQTQQRDKLPGEVPLDDIERLLETSTVDGTQGTPARISKI